MNEIYLNSAGHGRPEPEVINRMIAHLRRELDVGPDRARAEVAEEFDRLRANAAALLSADPARTGLCATTCAMWFSIVARLPLAGKRVLVAPHEWFENLAALNALSVERNFTVEMLPEIDLANPDLSAWAERIDEDVAAICLPMVTSVGGHLYPIEAIGKLPRPAHTRLVIDAAQAVGQVPVDVGAMNCDVFVATTRKWLRAPRQTALFWVREGVVGTDGNPLEAHELEPADANNALRLAQGTALERALGRGIDRLREDLQQASRQIRQRAAELGLESLGEEGAQTTAVTVAIPRPAQAEIARILAARNCIVKWPDPRRDEPNSPEARMETALMRISPHLGNQPSDLDAVFDAIREVLAPA
ncbi:aminotransferase class V-fold PLP-dependent enzyme [Rhodobacteraceae bacterium NNCM2]|nr:aminotransferase class V-fold PLP-dependent enzyme [Coraliihabitans acroporae]